MKNQKKSSKTSPVCWQQTATKREKGQIKRKIIISNVTIHHSKYILRRQYITYREGRFRGRIQNNLYAPKLFPAILTNHLATVPLWSGLLLGDLSRHGESKDYENFAQHLEHIHMRPEVNSNRFEISLRDKISLRCEVTSLSAFT